MLGDCTSRLDVVVRSGRYDGRHQRHTDCRMGNVRVEDMDLKLTGL